MTFNILWLQLHFWQKYHQSGISMETTHIFFILWPGIHWYFWWFQWYSRIFSQDKIENLGWYSWTLTKKKLNPLRHPAGPEGLRSGLRSGPRAQRGAPEVSIYFFVRFHETTQGFNFILRKISVKPLKPSKISMKPGHKKKCVVSI